MKRSRPRQVKKFASLTSFFEGRWDGREEGPLSVPVPSRVWLWWDGLDNVASDVASTGNCPPEIAYIDNSFHPWQQNPRRISFHPLELSNKSDPDLGLHCRLFGQLSDGSPAAFHPCRYQSPSPRHQIVHMPHPALLLTCRINKQASRYSTLAPCSAALC